MAKVEVPPEGPILFMLNRVGADWAMFDSDHSSHAPMKLSLIHEDWVGRGRPTSMLLYLEQP
jgi:hypothetical protein